MSFVCLFFFLHRLAADRSVISLLPLPMASGTQAAVFPFSSCSFGRSKWPARTQLATCLSWPGGQCRCLFGLHWRSSRPKWSDSKREKGVKRVLGEAGGICPIQICLIGFDSQQLQGNNGLFNPATSEWKAVALRTRMLLDAFKERGQKEKGELAMDFG